MKEVQQQLKEKDLEKDRRNTLLKEYMDIQKLRNALARQLGNNLVR